MNKTFLGFLITVNLLSFIGLLILWVSYSIWGDKEKKHPFDDPTKRYLRDTFPNFRFVVSFGFLVSGITDFIGIVWFLTIQFSKLF